MDDKQKTGKADRIRINIHEPYELRDWSKKFGVTHEQLIALVEKHGVMAAEVEKHVRPISGEHKQ